MKKARLIRVKGFTLIELLVVVSIIALLVSILLPALQEAREQAKFVTCKTRMRGQGQAISMYAASFKELYPPGDSAAGHDIWGWIYAPVNLGHLLESNTLGMPATNKHPFYCPAMEAGNWMKGVYGFVFDSADRGFQWWGTAAGYVTNIGYDYRDTFDGDSGAYGAINSPSGEGYRKMSGTVYGAALSVDAVSWGVGRFAHIDKYNFVRGDASVDTWYDDGNTVWSGKIGYAWELTDVLNSTGKFCVSGVEDQVYFEIFLNDPIKLWY
jgi:prepilin-type N-terminal cleavage/methylation domain-containing protein